MFLFEDDGNISSDFKSWTYQLPYCRNRSYPYRSVGDTDLFCNKTRASWSGVFRSVIDESSKCKYLKYDVYSIVFIILR